MESFFEATPSSDTSPIDAEPIIKESLPVEGGNPEVIHDIPREIHEFTQSLWIDNFRYFKDGLIILENLPIDKVKTLLGIGFGGESVPTGLRFRFSITPDRQSVSSEPYFSGKKPIPEDGDIDQHTLGKLHLRMGDSQFQNTSIEVDALDTGNEKVYKVTIIPDAQMTPDQTLLYYQSAADFISGKVGVESK